MKICVFWRTFAFEKSLKNLYDALNTIKGGFMSRHIREESATGYYHVMQRGAGKQILFEDDLDYRRYLDKLAECRNEMRMVLAAYCLMNNHVHLLIKVDNVKELSKIMSRIGTSYAAYYNTRYEHVGNVFQGRFVSSPINDETYLLECLRYIHNNPVKSNFGNINEYTWSSYNDYITNTGITDIEETLSLFDSQRQFEEFHREECQAKFDDCDVTTSSFEDGLKIIREYFGNIYESSMIVKMLGKPERDKLVIKMKKAGLSNHQIELITGISRDIIRRI